MDLPIIKNQKNGFESRSPGGEPQQNQDLERKIMGILRILSQSTEPIGAVAIARELDKIGIVLDSRTVRYHMKIMDERGMTRKVGREGRLITSAGLKELGNSLVFDRVGYVISKIESMSFQVTFDPEKRRGKLIMNTALVPEDKFEAVRKELFSVLIAGIGLSRLVCIRRAGEALGGLTVPEGMVGIGTVCSIVVNGVLIKQGIPVDARFGGVIEMEGGAPRRFTDIINYGGSSADPLELFMRGRFTDVRSAARMGAGKVLANFREIPAAAVDRTREILESLRQLGFTGVLGISKPGQSLFGVATSPNRCGIAVMGGLNGFAACHEAGLAMNIRAISTMAEFEELELVDVV